MNSHARKQTAPNGVPSSADRTPAPRDVTLPRRPTVVGRILKGAYSLGHKFGVFNTPPEQVAQNVERVESIFQAPGGFLGPSEPIQPQQPEGEPPRRWQYQPGANIQYTPRSGESVTFAQLRALSEYTLVRIVIERIKEALKAHEWDIVPDDDAAGDQFNEDIVRVKKFFEKPDRRATWDTWLGEFIEDMLTIDALSIYLHRTYSGDVWALEIIDGATIKPLIDSRGFMPLEPWPAYQQVIFGVPYVNLTERDLFYRPRNRRSNRSYGFGPVEQTIITVNLGMRREIYNLAKFTDGNMPEAFAKLPPEWTVEQVKAWNDYWNDLLSGDPQNRAKMRWIPGGPGVGDVERFKDDEVFGLHNSFDEWMARILCFAFGLSPQAFIQMTNRAVAQELGDVEAEQGIGAAKRFVSTILNDVIDNVLDMPWLQFRWVTDRSRMQQKRVERNDKYTRDGIFQVDEVRIEEGKKPLGLKPGIVTATGYVPYPPEAYIEPPPWAPPPAPPPEPLGVPPAPPSPLDDGTITPENATNDDQTFGEGAGEPGGVEPSENLPVEAMERAYTAARLVELGKWERYGRGRLEKGRSPCGFSAEYIDTREAAEIEGLMKRAKLPDEISYIFATRRKSKNPPMRLRPPAHGDGAKYRGDVGALLRPTLERIALEAASGHAAKEAVAGMATELEKMAKAAERPPTVIEFRPVNNITVPPAPSPSVKVQASIEKVVADRVEVAHQTVNVATELKPEIHVPPAQVIQQPAPPPAPPEPRGPIDVDVTRDPRTNKVTAKIREGKP